jgi:hypothetical protein
MVAHDPDAVGLSSWKNLNGTIGSTTRAGPAPTVPNAMLTPSRVCAYLTRGSERC